jgi:hypothetical protein
VLCFESLDDSQKDNVCSNVNTSLLFNKGNRASSG